MTIRVLSHKTQPKMVEPALIVDTVERNRDRNRTVGNMVLTMAGILISMTIVLIVFSADKKINDIRLATAFFISVFAYVLTGMIGIASCFLRTKRTITTEAQFISDLLSLFLTELRLLRLSCTFLALGMLGNLVGLFFFIFR